MSTRRRGQAEPARDTLHRVGVGEVSGGAVDPRRLRPADSVVIAADVPRLAGELAISAATLVELHLGVLITSGGAIRAERLRRLSALQRRFDALPVDDSVATSYGQLAAALSAAGAQPRSRVEDLLIAATAGAYSARMYMGDG